MLFIYREDQLFCLCLYELVTDFLNVLNQPGISRTNLTWSRCIMLFYIFLDLICLYFVKYFCIHVHEDISLKFSFFFYNVFGFGMRECLFHKMIGSVPSSIFWFFCWIPGALLAKAEAYYNWIILQSTFLYSPKVLLIPPLDPSISQLSPQPSSWFKSLLLTSWWVTDWSLGCFQT